MPISILSISIIIPRIIRVKRKFSFIFVRLCNYEYWPYAIFYFPVLFYGIYLALRSRSFMYFSTANPGMIYGGVLNQSKHQILSYIPKKYSPNTVFIKRTMKLDEILKSMSEKKISYPFIIKPDVGERGKGVELITCKNELENYLAYNSKDVLIQEYINHDIELGILYHIMPGKTKGQITSIVRKGFLSVTGDGERNLKELIDDEIRANSRLEYLYNKFSHELNMILPNRQIKLLEPIGNHCRGTTFYNAQELINDKLNEIFDGIAQQIQGYNYGRFDIRVTSLEDLFLGKNIIILELNGVSS